MKRATITLLDDLEQALERFADEQAVPVQLTAIVQAAVREYLGERGYLPSASKLRIRPAKRGISTTHALRNSCKPLRTMGCPSCSPTRFCSKPAVSRISRLTFRGRP